MGTITFITRMTRFWVSQSGHCNHCTSRLSLSATARMAFAGARVPHPTHVMRSTRLHFLYGRWRNRIIKRPITPRMPHLALPRKRHLASRYQKVTQLRLAPIRLSTRAAAAVRARRPHEIPARSGDRNSGRYWVRTSDLSRVKRALYHFEALGCRPLWAILNVPEPG